MARTKIDPTIKLRGIHLAERIKSEREDQDLSQSELSKIANISLDTLRAIENKKIFSPGVFLTADLVHALNGNLEEWIADADAKTRKRSRK